MAQALLNNLANNNQDMLSQLKDNKSFMDSKNFLADNQSSFDKSFTNAMNKQTVQQDKNDAPAKSNTTNLENDQTLGDLKATSQNYLSEFNNLLKEVTQEIQSENSLDLTLGKEIAETIENLAETIDENSDLEVSDTLEGVQTIVDTTINTIVQPVADVVKQVADKLNSEESVDDELTVTLNGKDLDSFLEDFGVTNLDAEVEIIKPDVKAENIEEGKTLEELVDEDTLRELNIEAVEVETSTGDSDSSDLMNNQSAEEQGIKAMLHVDADFSEFKVEQTQNNVSTQTAKTADVSPSKILEQITKQMEGLNSGSKVNIVLNPESLGKVSVQLINTKEGLSAQFTCATQEARNLIMKGLDGLKDTLLAQGVSVDNVSVKLSESQEAEYNADWTEQEGSRGGNKEQRGSKEGSKDERERFEQMMSFAQDENGNV